MLRLNPSKRLMVWVIAGKVTRLSMRLRRQLTLLAIVFLLLPVAGLMFLREIEQLLRLGQEQALIASARAVADRIESEPELHALIAQSNSSGSLGLPLYSFAADPIITLDGYDDDWRFLALQQNSFASQDLGWQLMLIAQGSNALGFLTVQDGTFDYHDPSVGFPASGDFAGIYHQTDRLQGLLVLRTSAPGEMQVVYSKDGINEQVVHGARAVWRELANGYQIEFSLPKVFLSGAVTLGIYDQSSQQWLSNVGVASSGAQQLYSNLQVWPALNPIQQSEVLQQSASVFAHPGNRIRIVNQDQWVLADKNRLFEISNSAPPMAWLVKRLINDAPLSEVEREVRQAQISAPEVASSITDAQTRANWYRWDQSSNLARVSVPIYSTILHETKPVKSAIGAVVVEQTTYQWLAMADRAFKRLMLYSVLSMSLLTLVLFLYASWLSIRIQRLNRAADNSINTDGSINARFPTTKIKDEIGDLQTSYGQLLARVAQYNDYLRSLAVKLSHELRTPLAIVSSSLDNLQSKQHNRDAAEVYIKRAQEGTERLSQIFTAMNSARSVEESIASAEVESIELTSLFSELSKAYAAVPRNKTITLNTNIQEAPLNLKVSADLLVQMLDKLMDNAVDFCPDGGQITIGLNKVEQYAHIWIENTGPILPEEMPEQLFASMVSMRATKGLQPHLGLGLHIVKLIVDFHHGSVQASNRESGDGVVFDIYLPLVRK